MFTRRARATLLAGLATIIFTGALAGCAAAPTAADDRLTVVAGLYPLQFVAEEVGGGRVSVTNLTQPGAEPHDVELTARQVARVAKADLVVYLSGLQPAVDQAVDQGAPSRRLDVAGVADELPAALTEQVAGETAPRGADPHVWLDPIRLTTIAEAVARALSDADPGHADAYTANAQALADRLARLDRAYADGLAGCQRTVFITSHAAFGYLAARYGLTQQAIAGLAPDSEPSPSRIARLQAAASAAGVTTIFFETLASPALAQAVASDLGLATAVLDPIEGLSRASAGDDYISLMEANLDALRQANGCP